MSANRVLCLLVSVAAAIMSVPAAALQITHVAANPTVINTAGDDTAAITFALSDPADVILDVYDARGKRVYTEARKGLEAGDQRLTWDGTDTKGEPVTAEAYTYILTATADTGQTVTYNPA